MDPYKILGIAYTKDKVIIKAAYKTKAKLHHPDKGGSAAKFVEINEAYYKIINSVEKEPVVTKRYEPAPEVICNFNLNKFSWVKGDLIINLTLNNISIINLSGTNLSWDCSGFTSGNITVPKKDLEEVEYNIRLVIYAANGGMAIKKYKVKKPLNWWGKLIKKIGL